MRKKIKIITVSGFFICSLVIFTMWIYQVEDIDSIDLINQELMATPTASGKRSFNLLDATQFTDSLYPWLGYPVTILSKQQLLGDGDNSSIPPNELKIKEVFIKYKDKKRIILNIPDWQIATDKEEDILTELHIKWYLQVLTWAKEVLPETDFGIFGIPYSPWLALKSTQRNMIDYQRVNDKLRPIIEASDTLYPLFKMFNYETNDLFYLMGTHLYISKTSGKPVYPIVSHKKISQETTNELVPADFIKQQCGFIRKNADGLVWWSEKKEQWDNSWYDVVAKHCFL